MTNNAAATASFATTLAQEPGKNPTGIVVPAEVMDTLGAGKRPPVHVTVNGHGYRTTIGVMGGRSMIPVSAAIRKATGLAAGDPIEVTIAVDTTPRTVDVPNDLAEAFEANPEAAAFFAGLSNSLQRYHVDNINAANERATLGRCRPSLMRYVRWWTLCWFRAWWRRSAGAPTWRSSSSGTWPSVDRRWNGIHCSASLR